MYDLKEGNVISDELELLMMRHVESKELDIDRPFAQRDTLENVESAIDNYRLVVCGTDGQEMQRVVCRYVICGHHIKQSMDQQGKVAESACRQLNSESDFSLSPFAPEKLVS